MGGGAAIRVTLRAAVGRSSGAGGGFDGGEVLPNDRGVVWPNPRGSGGGTAADAVPVLGLALPCWDHACGGWVNGRDREQSGPVGPALAASRGGGVLGLAFALDGVGESVAFRLLGFGRVPSRGHVGGLREPARASSEGLGFPRDALVWVMKAATSEGRDQGVATSEPGLLRKAVLPVVVVPTGLAVVLPPPVGLDPSSFLAPPFAFDGHGTASLELPAFLGDGPAGRTSTPGGDTAGVPWGGLEAPGGADRDGREGSGERVMW